MEEDDKFGFVLLYVTSVSFCNCFVVVVGVKTIFDINDDLDCNISIEDAMGVVVPIGCGEDGDVSVGSESGRDGLSRLRGGSRRLGLVPSSVEKMVAVEVDDRIPGGSDIVDVDLCIYVCVYVV